MRGSDVPVKYCRVCGKEMKKEDWILKYKGTVPQHAQMYWRRRVYCSRECFCIDSRGRLDTAKKRLKDMEKNKIIELAKMINGNPVGVVPQETAETRYVPDVIKGEEEFNVQMVHPKKEFWSRKKARFDGRTPLRRVVVLVLDEQFEKFADSFLVLIKSNEINHMFKLSKTEEF